MADGPPTLAEGACGGPREFRRAPTDEDPVQNLDDDRERQESESGSWHQDIVRWQKAINMAYPEWKTKFYFVPPVHMNKPARHKEEETAGGSVTVAIAPDTSHTQDDLAVQHVLHCFQYLANRKEEVMFVLCGLDFPNYLKLMRIYSPKSNFVLPKTSDPILKNEGYDKGDFDILVLHRRYGVLGCEVKSKGYKNFEDPVWNEDQKKAVVNKINEAVEQLNKYREVLSHILSDLKPDPRLQISLILPYLDRKRLTDLLNENVGLKQELCVHLELPETSDPTPFCLLSDDMSDKYQPWQLTDAVKTSLDAWWCRVVSDRGHDPYMTETRYLNIISRFFGPDTVIPGPRTMGEAVAYMADQFMKFPPALTPEQLGIVNKDWPYLWLDGPPGVGKTVVLISKALQWLEAGMEVHVVSLYDQGLAAAELICSELRYKSDEKKHKFIHPHHTPSDGEGSVLEALETAAKSHKIAVVMDEANEVMSMRSETDQSCPLSSHYESFVHRIVHELDIKRLWAASCHPVGRGIMDNCRLTRSLRAPPAIARETAKSSALKMMYPEFKLGDIPPASDGVGWVKVIEHLSSGEHHGVTPADCDHCGKELAEFLLKDLQVGVLFPRNKEDKDIRPLKFKDIFILSIKPFPNDLNKLAEDGQRHFLLGLRDGRVPVKVVQREDRERVKSMARSQVEQRKDRERVKNKSRSEVVQKEDRDSDQSKSRSEVVQKEDHESDQNKSRSEVEDEVIASDIYTVRGLQRPLVVCVQAEEEGPDHKASDMDLTRLYGMSRAVAQLVCVCTPGVARDAGWPS